MWVFPLSIHLATVIDEIKRELQTTDKALAVDLGYDVATGFTNYSKAKHGAKWHPMSVERWLNAPAPVLAAFLRVVKRLHAAEVPAPPTQYPDADLLDDIAGKLAQLRTRMVRADLRVVTEERRRA